MNKLNGGYVMVSYDASQTELSKAYATNKPVIAYDENDKAYWGLIKETSEIVDGETIYTYTLELLNQIDALVDSAGNSRFIEGEITTPTITGLTFSYAKWSLSGSHLMMVLAGTIENGATIAGQGVGVLKDLPLWVKNKIYPVWANNYIELKSTQAYNADWTTQNLNMVLVKDNVDDIRINTTTSFTATKERSFRIQFDLLIDAE